MKSDIEECLKQKEQTPAEYICKDALMKWAKFVLKCQEEELAKYDGPSYAKAATIGRIDAYKVLIAKLNSFKTARPKARNTERLEQTCRTCYFYENDCPFIRGKLIPYPNKA